GFYFVKHSHDNTYIDQRRPYSAGYLVLGLVHIYINNYLNLF
ncbi:MAG: hypothetical protein PWR29_1842, partial [Methanolobus sp.]|nr:hypothetical protein [Methanolobus sp.]